MNAARTSAARTDHRTTDRRSTDRWAAAITAIVLALGVLVGAIGNPISAAAADPEPGIRGTLLGDRTLPPTGGTLIEQVQYENLTPGLHYGMDVRLLNLDGTETGIEVMENFTPIAQAARSRSSSRSQTASSRARSSPSSSSTWRPTRAPRSPSSTTSRTCSRPS